MCLCEYTLPTERKRRVSSGVGSRTNPPRTFVLVSRFGRAKSEGPSTQSTDPSDLYECSSFDTVAACPELKLDEVDPNTT